MVFVPILWWDSNPQDNAWAGHTRRQGRCEGRSRSRRSEEAQYEGGRAFLPPIQESGEPGGRRETLDSSPAQTWSFPARPSSPPVRRRREEGDSEEGDKREFSPRGPGGGLKTRQAKSNSKRALPSPGAFQDGERSSRGAQGQSINDGGRPVGDGRGYLPAPSRDTAPPPQSEDGGVEGHPLGLPALRVRPPPDGRGGGGGGGTSRRSSASSGSGDDYRTPGAVGGGVAGGGGGGDRVGDDDGSLRSSQNSCPSRDGHQTANGGGRPSRPGDEYESDGESSISSRRSRIRFHPNTKAAEEEDDDEDSDAGTNEYATDDDGDLSTSDTASYTSGTSRTRGILRPSKYTARRVGSAASEDASSGGGSSSAFSEQKSPMPPDLGRGGGGGQRREQQRGGDRRDRRPSTESFSRAVVQIGAAAVEDLDDDEIDRREAMLMEQLAAAREQQRINSMEGEDGGQGQYDRGGGQGELLSGLRGAAGELPAPPPRRDGHPADSFSTPPPPR
ncbi:hypothetical protein THAOC_33242, partial [Thalassiosira oceanica]